MLELIKLGDYEMYRSKNPHWNEPRELRAWVDNPFELFGKDPAYLLIEIQNADGQTKTAQVREVNSANVFTVPFENIHVIHNYQAGKVAHIYGEVPS